MAQAMASMAGLRGSTQAVLDGSLQLSGSSRLTSPAGSNWVAMGRPSLTVRNQQAENEGKAQTSRRAMFGLVAGGLAGGTFVKAVLAEAKPIKLGPPPPPSGGLPGTLNSDEARDVELPLKNRFYIQPLTPAELQLGLKSQPRTS